MAYSGGKAPGSRGRHNGAITGPPSAIPRGLVAVRGKRPTQPVKGEETQTIYLAGLVTSTNIIQKPRAA